MREILATLEKYAQSDAAILLTGESGTGKEVLANYIKRNSARHDDAFLSVNCAAIPNELIESELFGYERGAFTGANRDGKPGIFELANGGTIFLDEVGELSLVAQSKLLRVLENGEFRRVGGSKTHKADVRVISATNRDLKKMITQGQFRADLYYRLCVIPVEIPPLREREEDIRPLSELFLGIFNRKYRMERRLSPELLTRLLCYPWPGNIRELRNVLENYVITGSEPELWSGGPSNAEPPSAPPPEPAYDAPLRTVLERTEQNCVRSVLERCGWDVPLAAEQLGIHRSVLYKKMAKYGLSRSARNSR